MKINRHGHAKVLTQSEIQQIFNDGLDNHRDRTKQQRGYWVLADLTASLRGLSLKSAIAHGNYNSYAYSKF